MSKIIKCIWHFMLCMVTRAIHVDIVMDLSTEEFLSALENFIARCDLPTLIYSNNAANFVGSRNVLNQSVAGKYLSENCIDWKTIAPRIPHQGGIWEAVMKSGKGYLVKAIDDQRLNLIELYTIATKVEAILNSCSVGNRYINSFVEPLMPGHFLTGSAIFQPPIVDDAMRGAILYQRFFLWRRIVEFFWHSWWHNYVS